MLTLNIKTLTLNFGSLPPKPHCIRRVNFGLPMRLESSIAAWTSINVTKSAPHSRFNRMFSAIAQYMFCGGVVAVEDFVNQTNEDDGVQFAAIRPPRRCSRNLETSIPRQSSKSGKLLRKCLAIDHVPEGI
jgi:hypothetical protein